MLAAAEIGVAVLLGGKGLGRKSLVLMGAVAERLLRRVAAGAPVIGLSRLDGHGIRGFLGNWGSGIGVSYWVNASSSPVRAIIARR